MKTCYKCGANKPLDDFYKDKSSKDGHWNQCKDCYRTNYKDNKPASRLFHKATESDCSVCGPIVAIPYTTKLSQQRYACPNSYSANRLTGIPRPQKIVKGLPYGLTAKERTAYMDGKVCAICGSNERLVVDHCHTNNKIRDVLCHFCNTGLGLFREDQNILRRAIKYLETHKPHTV